MTFKKGDRVKIATTSRYYKDGDRANPKDCEGTIDNNYLGVKWDNGTHNSYNETDLVLVAKGESDYSIF